MFRFPWLVSRTRKTGGRKPASRRLACEPLERREVLADLVSAMSFAAEVGQTFATDIDHDAQGNTYLSGYIDAGSPPTGPLDFDPANTYGDDHDIVESNLESSVRFLAKYDSAGAFQWVLPIYGPPGPQTVRIATAVGSMEEVYFSGVYSGSVTVGGFTVGPHVGTSDRFIGRVDAGGTVSWLQGFDFEGLEIAAPDLALDAAAGRLYLAGEQTPAPVYPAGENSSVVAAFNVSPAGASLAWSVRTSSAIVPRDVTVDSAGAVYVVGLLIGSADFNPGSGTFTVSAGSGRSPSGGFVWKLTQAGGFGWARAFQGSPTATSDAWAVAVDKVSPGVLTDDRIVVVGGFSGSVDFQYGKGTLNLPNVGGADPYLVSLSMSGSVLVARSFLGTVEGDAARDVEIDAAGNIYVSGTIGVVAGTNLPDFQFVAKIDRAGTLQSHIKLSGTLAGGYRIHVSVDPTNGTVHTVGSFRGNLDVDLDGDGTVDIDDALVGDPSPTAFDMFWLTFTL